MDVGAVEVRKEKSPASLRIFFNIMKKWDVKDDDARRLLGGISNGPFYELKKNPTRRVLTADQMLRISYLVGIYKALNILHSKQLADRWIQLPNTNRMFHGTTPLAYMIRGEQPAMQNVRRLLDARRGGI
jgi:hypothetical protein